jgi:hypothetical protein
MTAMRSLMVMACAGLIVGCVSPVPPPITEKSFQDDPSSTRTRDLAYVADRKAKMAEALAVNVAGNASAAR